MYEFLTQKFVRRVDIYIYTWCVCDRGWKVVNCKLRTRMLVHSCMCAPAQINQISCEFLWHISRTLTHTHAHNYNNIKIKRYSSEKTASGKNFLFDRTKNDKRKWEWDTCNKYRMKESERESVNSRTMIVVVRYGIVYWKLASSKLCKRGRKCEREKI